MNTPITQGPHHIGLTVSHLEDSARFFTQLLGWKEVQRLPDYPAIFVSDGHTLITLWAVLDHERIDFDRRSNVGLHHLALLVDSETALQTLHTKLQTAGTPIEFAPQPVGDSPARHFICQEPSGIRIEFFWPGN